MSRTPKPFQPGPNFRSYSEKEVSQHNKVDDAWIIVGGQVLDVTNFMQIHPGGSSIIAKFAGQDCTDDFAAMHSPKDALLAQEYSIGYVRQKAKL